MIWLGKVFNTLPWAAMAHLDPIPSFYPLHAGFCSFLHADPCSFGVVSYTVQVYLSLHSILSFPWKPITWFPSLLFPSRHCALANSQDPTWITFVVLKKGSASKFFNPSRGLKQGCPLPPQLFLKIEGLSRAILEAKRVGAITGVRMGSDLLLSHFLFIDGVLRYINGSLGEAKKLKQILDLYSKAGKAIEFQ